MSISKNVTVMLAVLALNAPVAFGDTSGGTDKQPPESPKIETRTVKLAVGMNLRRCFGEKCVEEYSPPEEVSITLKRDWETYPEEYKFFQGSYLTMVQSGDFRAIGIVTIRRAEREETKFLNHTVTVEILDRGMESGYMSLSIDGELNLPWSSLHGGKYSSDQLDFYPILTVGPTLPSCEGRDPSTPCRPSPQTHSKWNVRQGSLSLR